MRVVAADDRVRDAEVVRAVRADAQHPVTGHRELLERLVVVPGVDADRRVVAHDEVLQGDVVHFGGHGAHHVEGRRVALHPEATQRRSRALHLDGAGQGARFDAATGGIRSDHQTLCGRVCEEGSARDLRCAADLAQRLAIDPDLFGVAGEGVAGVGEARRLVEVRIE